MSYSLIGKVLSKQVISVWTNMIPYISSFLEGLMVLWDSAGVIQSSEWAAHVHESRGGWVAFVDSVSRPASVLGPLSMCVYVCVFVWVGSVDPKTEYIWSRGHIAEPGARAPIHLPFPLSVFLPHICLHMQDCLWNACCFHAVNQIPHEACYECVKHISGDAVWNGNVTFKRAGIREL